MCGSTHTDSCQTALQQASTKVRVVQDIDIIAGPGHSKECIHIHASFVAIASRTLEM
jgi:hypothetical protein